MNDTGYRLEPLSPELDMLIFAAGGDDGPDDVTRARLYSRLSSTLALPPAPISLGGEPLGLAGKAAALLPASKPLLVTALVAAGVGLAGIGYMATAPSSTGEDEVSTPETAAGVVPPDQDRLDEEALGILRTEPIETAEQTADPASTETSATTTGAAEVSKRAASSRRRAPRYSFADERRLIEAARSALRRGEADRALRLLDRHRKRFERGRLLEERDALYVMSLSKAGRHHAAERSARRFFETYPKTVFLDAVNAALRRAP